MKIFPTLYQKTNTGAIQSWSIRVFDNVIQTAYGQVDGKIQTTQDTIKAGKNEGKSSATTKEEQAIKEASAKWTKQKKKGYSESLSDAENGLIDTTVIQGGIEPMLAHKYRDHSAKIQFPCYGQRKYDGIRCIAVIEPEGTVKLWSRTRKPITSVPHINKHLAYLAGEKTLVFDGELYNHKYHDKFEEIVSLVRQQVPAPGHEIVQYHVYDLVSDEDFQDRNATLKDLLLRLDPKIVVPVETVLLKNEEELQERFAQFVEENYEGLMARNIKGPYQNKRSYNLQKVKTTQDLEYKILGVEEGRGKDAGTVGAFLLETPTKKPFKARLKGTYQYRGELFRHPELWEGKWLTVSFQQLTSDSIPRFPIGKALREGPSLD